MTSSIPEFILAQQHPLEALILKLRDIILNAAPVEESIKWNAPNYSSKGIDCLTFHFPRKRSSVMLILHSGAKKKGIDRQAMVQDPEKMLTWLGAERASLSFETMDDLLKCQSALSALLREWISRIA